MNECTEPASGGGSGGAESTPSTLACSGGVVAPAAAWRASSRRSMARDAMLVRSSRVWTASYASINVASYATASDAGSWKATRRPLLLGVSAPASDTGSWKATRGTPLGGVSAPVSTKGGAGLSLGGDGGIGEPAGAALLAMPLADNAGDPLMDPADLPSAKRDLAPAGEGEKASGWLSNGCRLAEARWCWSLCCSPHDVWK
mmetsp:Transcript_58228/g.173256  ORF Transcript_58228/g.173256 Transcript_58228/m.173256 type:complete len:202 (-) Transcript_58228:118-723(-)